MLNELCRFDLAMREPHSVDEPSPTPNEAAKFCCQSFPFPPTSRHMRPTSCFRYEWNRQSDRQGLLPAIGSSPDKHFSSMGSAVAPRRRDFNQPKIERRCRRIGEVASASHEIGPNFPRSSMCGTPASHDVDQCRHFRSLRGWIARLIREFSAKGHSRP